MIKNKTTMDYKEKLEEAKMLYESANADQRYVLETLFPELKESEDEKLRKELVKFLEGVLYLGKNAPFEKWDKSDCSKWIAWLEKQGEQKPSTIDIDKMVDDYANNKERGNEEFGKPVPCMIRAYRQGLNDAIGKVVLKTAWSEEDDVRLQACIDALQAKSIYGKVDTVMTKWLESLKQRIVGG